MMVRVNVDDPLLGDVEVQLEELVSSSDHMSRLVQIDRMLMQVTNSVRRAYGIKERQA